MTTTETQEYTLIETEDALKEFASENKDIQWMGFDTEFVGERRYMTLLCLIQIATKNGNYLLDAIRVKDLSPLFEFIVNPAILKITHAGSNDYRLLYRLHGIIPKNVFDTQVAAGFIGYRYPTSFQKVLEAELGVRLNKSYTVTDWQQRPLKPKQIKYALNDIIYLERLYHAMMKKLEANNRVAWLQDELSLWEQIDTYSENEHREALEHKIVHQLGQHEQVFLIRLCEWRRRIAKEKNYSKEMIFTTKQLGTVVRNIHSGKEALLSNRILSTKIVEKNWLNFNHLYQKKITDAERALLTQIPPIIRETSEQELTNEFLFLLIKKRCQDMDVAHSLVISKNVLKRLRHDPSFTDVSLTSGWHRELLGEELVQWISHQGNLSMEMKEGHCVIKM